MKEEDESVMTMNDTNFDDDENPSLSDDDEMDNLRANLESVLMNSSKPGKYFFRRTKANFF